MKIEELREYAEDNGFDSLQFSFVNQSGLKVTCKWLDAYFGIFQIEDEQGFFTVKQWKEVTGDRYDLTVLTPQ